MNATLRRLKARWHTAANQNTRRRFYETLAIAVSEPCPPRLVGRHYGGAA
jgi:hypothetical protein